MFAVKLPSCCWVGLFLIGVAPLSLAREKKPILPETDGTAWLRPKYIGTDEAGKYILYDVRDQSGRKCTAVLQSTDLKTKSEWPDAHAIGILDGIGVAIIEKPGDSLAAVSLATKDTSYISHASEAKIAVAGGRQWLAFSSTEPGKNLVIRNDRGAETRFTDVTAYSFGTVLPGVILHLDSEYKERRRRSLAWVDLETGNRVTLWSVDYMPGAKVQEPRENWNARGDAVVFATDEMRGETRFSSVWYYKAGMVAPESLVTSASPEVGGDVLLPESTWLNPTFVATGDVVSFRVEEKPGSARAKREIASVDVWSYKDSTIQSRQLLNADGNTSSGKRVFLTTGIRLADRRIKRLEATPRDTVRPESISASYYLVRVSHGGEDDNEWNWNPASEVDVLVRSFDDNSEQVLARGMSRWSCSSYYISPDGRRVVYYNAAAQNWFVRDLGSRRERNLTAECNADWAEQTRAFRGEIDGHGMPAGRPVWIGSSSAILLPSRTDVWKISCDSSFAPQNITKGHSIRPDVVYRLSPFSLSGDWALNDPALTQQIIFVHALDWNTRDEGFLQIPLGGHGPNLEVEFTPARAELLSAEKDASGYIVSMNTAVRALNLYFTKDFRSYAPITDIHPENDYHWSTAELLTWTGLSGQQAQGVLFKPDDFDPRRKYPVILSYYQDESERHLKDFGYPGISQVNAGEIYAPLYNGRGYLVFYVDILPGNPGQAGRTALDAVTSAAQMLSSKPWVDERHLAIFGHSFGGFETDYIAAHTERFAAAIASSGWPDFVSAYNSLRKVRGDPYQSYAENGHAQFRSTLWERPLDYIDNSAVFAADRVTTPMLLMTNIGDLEINFFWGVEWFNALRRLGKKAWMLQYDGEGHNLGGKLARLDFDIRMQQFLDHYLKGAPPPQWMTRGIRAEDKGYEAGFELDISGREP